MNSIDDYSFLLGWMLIQPARIDWLDDLVPSPVLSADRSICAVRPQSDDWYENDALSAFLMARQRNVEGNFIFLDSFESAQAMRQRWLDDSFLPVALALRPHSAKRLDETLKRVMIGSNGPDYRHSPLEEQSFTGRERLLGHEVLTYYWGFSGYLGNHLHHELIATCGVKPTAYGLIEDGDVAERFAAHMEKHDLGEPGLRLAYALYTMP